MPVAKQSYLRFWLPVPMSRQLPRVVAQGLLSRSTSSALAIELDGSCVEFVFEKAVLPSCL